MAAEKSEMNYTVTDNPVFQYKKLSLDTVKGNTFRTGTVFRGKDTLFRYSAWPSVCADENGVLYATSSAFGSAHICPFGKYAMYVSRDGGDKWSLPMILRDSYLPDGHGGIVYLGGGKLLANWAYHPGDVLFRTYWGRITGTIFGGSQGPFDHVRQSMLEMYPYLPPERLVGGSYVMTSDDYGVTWGDPVRVPVASPHGPCRLPDGTLLYLGKEYYASPEGTFEAFSAGMKDHITPASYREYIEQIGETRAGKECGKTPIVAYGSRDGGLTWEKRGICGKPAHLNWYDTSEPHAAVLSDGTLFGAVRVERSGDYSNDFTVYTSRSSDGGYTWSEWVCTHISGSPPHIMQHSSGALVCTVGRRNGPAPGEYAYVSHDSGQTWTEEYEILRGDDEDLGYPASVELPDHTILTVFYQHYFDPCTEKTDPYPSIMYAKWHL